MKFPAARLASVTLVACCVTALLPAGCKRRPASPSAATSASSTDAAPPPTSQAATEPVAMEIDGDPAPLPPAELHVRPSGSGLAASLATVTAPDPAGANTLRLDMTFPDLASVSELEGAEWHYKEPEQADEDPPEAITLRHRQAALEPVEAMVVIHLDDQGRAIVELTGTFAVFEPPEADKPKKTVWVTAKAVAPVRTSAAGLP